MSACRSTFPAGLFFFLLLLILSGAGSGLQAQDRGSADKQRMERLLQEETARYSSAQTDSLWKIPLLSALPCFFPGNESPVSDSRVFFGISDPGMTADAAAEQATLRALSLAALALKCRAQFLGDLYNQSEKPGDGSRYEELYGFRALLSYNPDDFRILRDTIIRSGERIIVLAYHPAKNESRTSPGSALLRTGGSVYNYESGRKDGSTLQRRISAEMFLQDTLTRQISGDSISTFMVNRRFASVRNSQSLRSNRYGRIEYYYRPCSREAESKQMDDNTGSDCRSGLWAGVLDQIYSQLGNYVKTHVDATARVTDQYSETRKEIIREKQRLNLRFRIGDARLAWGRLTIPLIISHEKE